MYTIDILGDALPTLAGPPIILPLPIANLISTQNSISDFANDKVLPAFQSRGQLEMSRKAYGDEISLALSAVQVMVDAFEQGAQFLVELADAGVDLYQRYQNLKLRITESFAKAAYASVEATIDGLVLIAKGVHALGEAIVAPIEAIVGKLTSDNITTTLGNTVVVADAGNDKITTLSGVNAQSGGSGSDFLKGGWQGDELLGGGGNDVIRGESGITVFGSSDILIGGKDDDILMGGKGADTFIFSTGDGDDVIGSFNARAVQGNGNTGYTVLPTGADFQSGVDKVQFENFDTVNSSNVMRSIMDTPDGALFAAEGTTVLFYDLQASQLSPDDFVFV